jgi:hypothetical protein
MRAFLLLVGLVLSLALAGVAAASPYLRFGVQDDAWLEYGPGTLAERVAQLDELGFELVRVTLAWPEIEPVRGKRDWSRADRLLLALREQGLTPVVTLWGTPRWANGGRSPNWAPRSGATFAAFAAAAARRYRFVRHWVIWNESNQRRWLRPTSAAVYVARILNPAYRAIRRANPSAKVAGGVTAPRAAYLGVSPVDFIRGMSRAGARLDAYAHHPYPLSPKDTPWSGGCDHCTTVTMATLERLLREVGNAFPRARIWLTEYGYQTNPPDRVLGVAPALQARYLADALRRAHAAPKVDMLIHYLYRDEPDVGRWQSGLETAAGRAKPARSAVKLPLAQVARTGARTTLWGQVRCARTPTRVVLQRAGGGAWRGVTRVRTTTRGYFQLTVQARRGERVRLWHQDCSAGAAVAVR